MKAANLLQFLGKFAYLAIAITVFMVDFTRSANSIDAFSSAKKVSSLRGLSPSYRWEKGDNFGHGFYEDDNTAQKVIDSQDALESQRWQHRRFEDIPQKRAPGWGKRSSDMDEDDQELAEKRAPGWGKRAPGWGKRAPGWGKRAPGWGKRAPGWGKRAPGWGKRGANEDVCQILANIVNESISRAVKADSIRIAKCENGETINEPFRK